MVSNQIYRLGGNLGLNKKEINDILSYKNSKQYNIFKNSSPIDVYKYGSDYGTISIKDFLKHL